MILKTLHISVYNMVFRNSGEVANKQRVIRVTSLTDEPLKNYLKTGWNWFSGSFLLCSCFLSLNSTKRNGFQQFIYQNIETKFVNSIKLQLWSCKWAISLAMSHWKNTVNKYSKILCFLYQKSPYTWSDCYFVWRTLNKYLLAFVFFPKKFV